MRRVIKMVVDYFKDNLPELKQSLCNYSDKYAEKTDTEWDDLAAELLRAVLGCTKGE